MKKNILLSLCMVMAMTAVMTSCKKDHDFISIRATISDYRDTGKDGKTYIETINNVDWVSWNDDDKVWINNTAYNVTVSDEGTSSRYATFDRVTYVDPDHPETDGNGYYAVYPASQVVSSTFNGFPQILLPQVQIYRTDGTDKNHGNQIIDAPMAAYCQASSTHVGLDFTNLCSLLKIDLSNMGMSATTEVAYITVSSTNKPLWGKATISGTNEPTLSSPSLTDLSTKDKTVTLDFTDNGSHGSDGSSTSTGSSSAAAHGVTSRGPFYVVLPPTSDVAGLTINIYVFAGNNDAQNRRTILKYTKSTNNNISIVNNNIYTTGDLSTIEGDPVSDVPFPGLGTGEFSVSRNKKVRFALGNLQYLASTGTWRFAENQWDHIGNAVGNTTPSSDRSTQTDWIDLFGYGTSGYNNHSPWQTTKTDNLRNNYATGHIYNTTNDWGVNTIINGGNQPNKWRTLSQAEWEYLIGQGLSSRTNANSLHIPVVYIKFSRTNKIRGTLIFPDGYNGTKPSNRDEIEISTWNSTYANSGAIFLPVTGQRSGSGSRSISDLSTTGFYWTSTYYTYDDSEPRAIQIYFDSQGDHIGYTDTYKGNAVRLVRDVN